MLKAAGDTITREKEYIESTSPKEKRNLKNGKEFELFDAKVECSFSGALIFMSSKKVVVLILSLRELAEPSNIVFSHDERTN